MIEDIASVEDVGGFEHTIEHLVKVDIAELIPLGEHGDAVGLVGGFFTGAADDQSKLGSRVISVNLRIKGNSDESNSSIGKSLDLEQSIVRRASLTWLFLNILRSSLSSVIKSRSSMIVLETC